MGHVGFERGLDQGRRRALDGGRGCRPVGVVLAIWATADAEVRATGTAGAADVATRVLADAATASVGVGVEAGAFVGLGGDRAGDPVKSGVPV